MNALPIAMATLVAGVGLFGLSVRSCSRDHQSAAQLQDRAQEQSLQTFVGTVIKNGDNYVLKDEATNVSYQLDDLEKVAEHEGKFVRVSGTLDSDTSTIRVSTLDPNG
jgi:uncharacterized membrane protein